MKRFCMDETTQERTRLMSTIEQEVNNQHQHQYQLNIYW